eukprot:TRINITY_DN4238_c0_g1_i1.p1 TRINITY_DN4238_c0_g1~~TRINITY_DN4238_c0_g1_i1.p1  ORF type:complete len:322 (-),score=68.90 TRINITY_DN4238_c0_g1_i1:53-1018(-)
MDPLEEVIKLVVMEKALSPVSELHWTGKGAKRLTRIQDDERNNFLARLLLVGGQVGGSAALPVKNKKKIEELLWEVPGSLHRIKSLAVEMSKKWNNGEGFSGQMERLNRGFEKRKRLFVPDMNSTLADCGKMRILDELLHRLKMEKHRVLVYSQMTKMMDILEEYMKWRGYNYVRLDGESKKDDRRDTVNDFQSNFDIFVFLLSTRAGGLGINLTTADTVIFYDSDWNPTSDSQAMDRAHRIGQTKEVNVYRLITAGSIEERVLKRANQKHMIQSLVIAGGNFTEGGTEANPSVGGKQMDEIDDMTLDEIGRTDFIEEEAN